MTNYKEEAKIIGYEVEALLDESDKIQEISKKTLLEAKKLTDEAQRKLDILNTWKVRGLLD